ncbi:MAG: hypothetical protein KAS53_07800 [Candidatus Cloacimonetes bacterium]|nr:hypothetical protein [Candidatus Cloacimonadota bacterium]
MKHLKETIQKEEQVKRNYLKIILQIILGGTFIFSAYSKIISPGLFEILLIDSGIVETRIIAAYLTRLLIGFELALGLLIFQPNYLKKIIIPVTIGLLAAFTLYLGYTGIILGDNENCGCFGELIKMTPVESIYKNIIFLIIAVFLYRKVETKKTKKILPVAITILSFLLVFLIIPITNAKDFKFEKYTSFEGYGRVDLAEGDHLLAVFNLDCGHCQETATDIWELKDQYWGIPEMFVLFYQEGDFTVEYFTEITNSQFSYLMIDENTFFDLIGNSPPRIYWLQNGEIKEIWDEDFSEKVEMNFIN